MPAAAGGWGAGGPSAASLGLAAAQQRPSAPAGGRRTGGRSSQGRPCHRKAPRSPPQGAQRGPDGTSPPPGRAGRGWGGPPRPVVPARLRGAQLQLSLESSPRVELRGAGFRLRCPLSCRRVLPLSLNPRPPRRGEAGPPPGAPPSFVPAPLSGSPQPRLSASTHLPPAPLEAPGPGAVWTSSLWPWSDPNDCALTTRPARDTRIQRVPETCPCRGLPSTGRGDFTHPAAQARCPPTYIHRRVPLPGRARSHRPPSVQAVLLG